ncbi:MAG: hypothetical protein ABWY54_03755 [Glaciihabitans sp.]
MTNVTAGADLATRSASFAFEVQDTLQRVLPGTVNVVSVTTPNSNRYWVRPDDAPRKNRIPLFVDGDHLADLTVEMFLSMDRHGHHLKTVLSKMAVHSTLDRQPLLRLEFDAAMHTAPIVHWHVHAERGAFSHLLARSHAVRPGQVTSPHQLSSLHLPVGGERFRPCLEDLLQFLIEECGIDSNGDWAAAIAEGRERWRRRQVRTVARDAPAEVADVLRGLGWTVEAPVDGGESENIRTLTAW